MWHAYRYDSSVCVLRFESDRNQFSAMLFGYRCAGTTKGSSGIELLHHRHGRPRSSGLTFHSPLETGVCSIFLQPPNPEALSFEVDFQIQQAIAALRRSSIRIQGAGRFGEGLSAIVLQRDTDASTALAALERAGIRISHFVTLAPTSSGPPAKSGADAGARTIRPSEHEYIV